MDGLEDIAVKVFEITVADLRKQRVCGQACRGGVHVCSEFALLWLTSPQAAELCNFMGVLPEVFHKQVRAITMEWSKEFYARVIARHLKERTAHMDTTGLAIDINSLLDSEPRIKDHIEAAESGEQVWMLYNISQAGSQSFSSQLAEALRFVGIEPAGDIDMDVWELDQQASRLTTSLERLVVVPDGTALFTGFWEDGGCWGVILVKE